MTQLLKQEMTDSTVYSKQGKALNTLFPSPAAGIFKTQIYSDECCNVTEICISGKEIKNCTLEIAIQHTAASNNPTQR